jgi:hypothetical protein
MVGVPIRQGITRPAVQSSPLRAATGHGGPASACNADANCCDLLYLLDRRGIVLVMMMAGNMARYLAGQQSVDQFAS